MSISREVDLKKVKKGETYLLMRTRPKNFFPFNSYLDGHTAVVVKKYRWPWVRVKLDLGEHYYYYVPSTYYKIVRLPPLEDILMNGSK